MRHTRYKDLPFKDLPTGEYRAQIRNPALAIIRENMRALEEGYGIRITSGTDIEGYAVKRTPEGELKTVDLNDFQLGEARMFLSRSFGRYTRNAYIHDLKEEASDGQYEVNTLIQTPDVTAMLFHSIRILANRYAGRYGAEYIDFGDKPFPAGNADERERAGSGGHIHIGLVDELDRNVFFGSKRFEGDYKIPNASLLYLAGNELIPVLHEASLLFAPTPDSYDRFGRQMSAPMSVGFGHDKAKSTALRYTYGEGPHLEVRYGGASMDPYLAMAVLTSALRDTVEKHVQVEERERPVKPKREVNSKMFGSSTIMGSLIELFQNFSAVHKELSKPEPALEPVADESIPKTYKHLVLPEVEMQRVGSLPLPKDINEARELFEGSKYLKEKLGPLHENVLGYYDRKHEKPKEAGVQKEKRLWREHIKPPEGSRQPDFP